MLKIISSTFLIILKLFANVFDKDKVNKDGIDNRHNDNKRICSLFLCHKGLPEQIILFCKLKQPLTFDRTRLLKYPFFIIMS